MLLRLARFFSSMLSQFLKKLVALHKDIPVKDFWSVKMKNAELVRLL